MGGRFVWFASWLVDWVPSAIAVGLVWVVTGSIALVCFCHSRSVRRRFTTARWVRRPARRFGLEAVRCADRGLSAPI